MQDRDIINSVLKGDTEKFGILVNTYSRMCFSIAYRVVQNADEAQDVVQDALISSYEHLAEFKGDAKFSTWLYRIVLNKALAFKNRTKYFDDVENESAKEESYDEELDLKTSEMIRHALTALNEKERLIIDLYYYQEQSIREISQICQISEVNTKVLLHRARKKMNEVLKKNGKFASNG